MSESYLANIRLQPFDNQRLARLCGQYNENIRHVENHLGVMISSRGNLFQISGEEESVKVAGHVLDRLYKDTAKEEYISPAQIHLYLQTMKQTYEETSSMDYKSINNGESESHRKSESHERNEVKGVEIRTKVGVIRGHTNNQRKYLENITRYDINFGIGPAGTGKTYLAVASAVASMERGEVVRILLVRPAVEAGEKLGFLPGGLEEKIEPYLRPLYDALFEMLGFERVNKLIEQNIIEVAPLAYMRGRTLNDAFIILDESQNTTTEQMKMFLTRIGFNSKAIITGDITQVDLPKGKKSGLIEARDVLKDIEGIHFTFFDSKDVVRHPLVQQIIEAYEKQEKKED